VIQLMPGVGPATAARLLDAMAEADPLTTLEKFKPPPAAAEPWPAFVEAVSLLRRRAALWPAELDLVLRWYAPHLERIHDDAMVRQADLAQLAQIAGSYPSRERFLTELTLDPPGATSDEAGAPLLDEDYLILSTIHSAKGQEWRSVFALNVVDGCLPSDLGTGTSAEIEEERRLLYVAMTRAKDQLHLIVPQRFYVHQQRPNGDRHVYAARTRFIPAAILRHFACCAWPSARPGPAGETAPPRAPVDIGARLRRMWG
jgi:DNA helicase-2/ATP-dependent DNA helicase PcrA